MNDEEEKSSGVGHESTIYKSRFNQEEEVLRSSAWQVLVPEFFQEYVAPDSVVVDVGAGDGHFIRHIKASRRVAVDLSSHVQELSKYGIEVLQCRADKIAEELDAEVDIVFMSNFLEHLPTKRDLFEVLESCYKLLKPGGRIMILQPNIRYVGSAYWDYIDHHIALTEHSLVEALEVCDFEIERMIPRFLPYTAKSSIGHSVGLFEMLGVDSSQLVSWYLRFPLIWRIFGKQTFVVAKKRG
jgi:2-polyprenyl-3-methyl-5-hydroxy-6-metoxy-1,4-benzoquinol methylase